MIIWYLNVYEGYTAQLVIDLDELNWFSELKAQKLHETYFAFVDCNICKWEPVQIMTRSHLDNDRESDSLIDMTLVTQNQLQDLETGKSIRVSPPVSGILPYTHAHVGRLDRRRPWDTSVTRDLLVKSVIRR